MATYDARNVFIVFVFVFLSLLCIILFSLWLLLSINDDDVLHFYT